MKTETWVVVGAGGLLVVFAVTAGAVEVVRRMGGDASLVDGAVHTDPLELAKGAGVSLDAYALARMMASEEPSGGELIKTAIAWCAVNMAARKGVAVSALLLQNTRHPGLFGDQRGGYATTAHHPTEDDLFLAVRILNSEVPDPTDGCIQFDRVRAERALHERDPEKYRSPEEIAQRRQSSGDQLVVVAGITPDLRFWRQA